MLNSKYIFLLFLIVLGSRTAKSQACTTLGQTPSTAFPVCGTTVFNQSTVPICTTNNLFVPGCSGSGNADYENKNPFFYKFTCYVSGSLGFLIQPLGSNEDYDWQLWDITGRNPDDIFSDPSLVVTGNWAGTYGNTGASASGVNYIQCASFPPDNMPTFAAMPNLIAGHEYLLMVSHYTPGQSGYNLSFGGGSAVITDPNIPHGISAKVFCDGASVTLKLNKKVKCNSLSPGGSEFSLLPPVATITGATPDSCAFGFDFDVVKITFSNGVPTGTYDLVISNGTDGNTLLDNCDNPIPNGERISFSYAPPTPIFADSIAKPKCATDSIRLYYPKKIKCASISPSGSDFAVSGSTPVTITSAGGNCINGETEYIIIKFSAPIYTKGNYILRMQTGVDGSPVIDECGQPVLFQTLPFSTADTVDAVFQYNLLYGCLKDTLVFSHDGAHDVNSWTWIFNGQAPVTTQTHIIVFPANSTNNALLYVSNGTCSDTASTVIKLDNEVKASFLIDNIICPEDYLKVINTSTGLIDAWKWTYDIIGTSTLKDPPPFLFPTLNQEAYYTVKLVIYNYTLRCSDSARKTLTVLDHCLIEVPTAFTPNNDGLNDYFHPHNALKANNYQFKVFNRWGQIVFQSNNWQTKWDGTIRGVKQATGVYVWMLSYVNRNTNLPVFRKGTITLIR